jgi:hypothetical protein
MPIGHTHSILSHTENLRNVVHVFSERLGLFHTEVLLNAMALCTA